MGVKAFKLITRKQLINYIEDKVSELYNLSKYNSLSDEELENLAKKLDEETGGAFTNYCILSDEFEKYLQECRSEEDD